MGAGLSGLNLPAILAALKGMVGGDTAAGSAATATGGALGPQSETGDILASVNPAAGSIDPGTMQTPGQGGGQDPSMPGQPYDYAKMAQYANVMKGLQNSRDEPPRELGHSPMLDLKSSANPQLAPIQPATRPAPGPNSVGAALAGPEGRALILALDQLNRGIGA